MQVMLCYVRKSWTPTGSNTASPEQQQAAIEGLVTAKGFASEWYQDVEGHRSGRSEQGRPEWLRLKAQLKREDVAGVAGFDLSRLYRNVKEFLQFVDLLERINKRLLLVQEMIDTGTASGRAVATILVTIHQLQADRTSERVTANIDYRRRELGHHHGPIPFGCDRKKGILVPNDDTSILERAYTLYAEGGYSYDALVSRLNSEGLYFRDRRGDKRPWNREDARRALYNYPLYMGHLPIGGSGKRTPTEIIYNTHEAIVSPDLCSRVANQLEQRRRHHGSIKSQKYSLSGICYCHTCGTKLYGYHRRDKRYYRHSGSKDGCPERWVDADVIEREVIDFLNRLNAASAWEYFDAYTLRLVGDDSQTLMLEKAIQAEEEKTERLALVYVNGKISAGDYARQLTVCNQRIEGLKEQLPTTHAREFKEVTHRLRKHIQELSLGGMSNHSQIIHILFERITVSAGHVVEYTPRLWLNGAWRVVAEYINNVIKEDKKQCVIEKTM